MNLMEQLEKTANEAYPEEGRINRGLIGESILGSGVAGHLAKKHNALGVNEDDSHTAANAKLGALGMGTVGALGGAAMGAGEFGGRGAVIGAGIGAAAYGLGGAAVGAANGKLHDMYDERLRSKQASSLMDRLEKTANDAAEEEEEEGPEEEVAKAQLPENEDEEKDKKANGNEVSHAEAGEEKSAAALMDSLEKLAEREYSTGEEVRDHAKFNAALSGGILGGAGAIAGGVLGGAKRGIPGAIAGAGAGGLGGGAVGAGLGAIGGTQTALLASGAKAIPGNQREEGESHMKDDARAAAIGTGAFQAAVQGSMKRSIPSAIAGGVTGAMGGGLMGAGVGNMRDRREAREEEQVASDLMDSLEKTAAGAFGAIKNTLSAASGKQYNALNKTQKANEKAMSPKALEANAKGVGVDNGGVSKARGNMEKLEGQLASGKAATQAAKATRNEARGKLAPAAVGVAGVGGAAAGSAATKKDQEKTASEAFMNEMFKEAATAILSMETPEVKAYRDPMDGIKFDR